MSEDESSGEGPLNPPATGPIYQLPALTEGSDSAPHPGSGFPLCGLPKARVEL